jgi:hypothetical protein
VGQTHCEQHCCEALALKWDYQTLPSNAGILILRTKGTETKHVLSF